MALDDDVREALEDLVAEHGTTLVYSRDDHSFQFEGYISRQAPVTVETESGGYTEVMGVDILTPTASLSEVEPQQGDRIEHGEHIYEVQPVLGQKTFRIISPSMTRIHTKLI